MDKTRGLVYEDMTVKEREQYGFIYLRIKDKVTLNRLGKPKPSRKK